MEKIARGKEVALATRATSARATSRDSETTRRGQTDGGEFSPRVLRGAERKSDVWAAHLRKESGRPSKSGQAKRCSFAAASAAAAPVPPISVVDIVARNATALAGNETS